MNQPKMPHTGHDKHLCYLVNLNFQNSNAEDYKQLVKKAEYMCKNCGRVAENEKNLCNPVKINE
ncbi:MAG: hypothetical protein ABFD79_16860 [Phycisphaerales bacterium]